MGPPSVRGALDNGDRVIRLTAPPMNLTYAYQDNGYTCLRYVASDGKREVWLSGELRCIADPIVSEHTAHWPAIWRAELRYATAKIDANPRDHESHSMVLDQCSCHRASLAEWLTSELLARLPKE